MGVKGVFRHYHARKRWRLNNKSHRQTMAAPPLTVFEKIFIFKIGLKKQYGELLCALVRHIIYSTKMFQQK